MRRGDRVIKKARESGGKVCRVACTKCQTCAAQDLDERAQIGSYDREAARHTLGNYQTKHFSTEGRNNYGGGMRERSIELVILHSACESDIGRELRIAGEFLQGRPLGSASDD